MCSFTFNLLWKHMSCGLWIIVCTDENIKIQGKNKSSTAFSDSLNLSVDFQKVPRSLSNLKEWGG